MNLDLSDVRRLSWSRLLEEAITKPGTLHEAYSRFWNYSLGNQILTLIQCRDRGIEPGPLASFNRWRELGRHVKRGEKAITLCMPIRIKCREWDQRREQEGLSTGDEQETGYRTVFVFKRNWFVLSQTDGEPYKPEPIPQWSQERALSTLDIREEAFTLIDGNCQGYATPARTIAVSPVAALPWKTMFHEIAHVLSGHLDDGRLTDSEMPEQSLREVEAESVALICCESLGLAGSDFCRGYIRHWLNGDRFPERSVQRIFAVADKVIRAGYRSRAPMLLTTQLPCTDPLVP